MKAFTALLVSSATIVFHLENILSETVSEPMGSPVSELRNNINAPPGTTCGNYEQVCSDEVKWRPYYPSEIYCKSYLFWTLCTAEDEDEQLSEIIDDSIRELEKAKASEN